MSGKMSRNKGMRNEYAVRDELRAAGFEADRVPASGAAQGFKGDVRFKKDHNVWFAEVKVRAGTTFKHLYDFHATHAIDGRSGASIAVGGDLWCIDIGDTVTKVMAPDLIYPSIPHKGITQAVKMHKMLQTCDFLVVRNDNRPFLYLRYRT